MSARYVIRKQDIGYHQWTLRDAKCRYSEAHDFLDDNRWSDKCDGDCDTFKFFSSAIATATEQAE